MNKKNDFAPAGRNCESWIVVIDSEVTYKCWKNANFRLKKDESLRIYQSEQRQTDGREPTLQDQQVLWESAKVYSISKNSGGNLYIIAVPARYKATTYEQNLSFFSILFKITTFSPFHHDKCDYLWKKTL